MGNNSSKEPRAPPRLRHTDQQAGSGGSSRSQADRLASQIYSLRHTDGRSSRPDLTFLTLGRDRDGETAASERPRETRQEKEARRAERERQARLKERERSLREEGVDGGFLVTLGTYTGPEDFNKGVVRQLQLERRLAPFWKGLDEHNESWTEAQLVAAVRGLPIPAADEITPAMERSPSQASSNPGAMETTVQGLTISLSSRSQSYQNESTLSASHPAFSSMGAAASTSPGSTSLLRGRAKTLASLATGAKSQSDLTPQEICLQKDPYVNGLPLEAYLYREASECPICFMYYPPYLNHTRCCDQPICSECFVQIKRPDPHPPEHEQPGETRPSEQEAETLVSEVAACPFCVTPEFGVSYDPPPFRRGLAYANHSSLLSRHLASAMSSSSSLAGSSTTGRRRAASLSANAPQVVTTDRVRPDWAKKLADARANALRRSAAATALHNAAYVLGNQNDGSRGIAGFGRRRMQFFTDSPGASGSGSPRMPEDGSSDLFPGRTSSRRNRAEDLEDLMMMEAIRLSLAAEDERKRKEEKDAAKEAKKKAKETKKEEKKAEKIAKKGAGNGSLYPAGSNDSVSTWTTTSMARSTSNLGSMPATVPEEPVQGKGKQPVQDTPGSSPLPDPTSLPIRSASQTSLSSSPAAGSRAHLPTPSLAVTAPPRALHMRHLSTASSGASSFADSNLPSDGTSGVDIATSNARDDGAGNHRSGTPPASSSAEPMFNFRSLAAMIGDEDKERPGEHIEIVDSRSRIEDDLKEPSPTSSPRVGSVVSLDGNRSRCDSGESSSMVPPPTYDHGHSNGDVVSPTPAPPAIVVDHDAKDLGTPNSFGRAGAHEATQ